MATLIERITTAFQAVGGDVKTLSTRTLPSGGTSGQVLSKVSATDYATQWVPVSTSDTPTLTHTLLWNAAATATNKYEPNPRPSTGYYRYVGPTDPATIGITLKNGDVWEQTS